MPTAIKDNLVPIGNRQSPIANVPVPFVDLKAQYQSIKTEIDEAIARVIDNTSFILGPEVAGFEQAFSDYVGARFCVGLNSGTAALHLALLAGGIGPGDGVIVTNDEMLAHRVRMLRDHGSDQKYRHKMIGYNFRLEGIQAAVLKVKLRHLDAWNDSRRAHAARYRELLSGANLILPSEMPY